MAGITIDLRVFPLDTMAQRNTDITASPAPEHPTASAVTLPPSLETRIEARLTRSEFETVEAYVTFVLEEVLTRVEDADEANANSHADSVDRSEVDRRLRSLGYLE